MTEEAKPAILVKTNPETGEVETDAEIGGFKFSFKTVIKDKRFWTAVTIITAIIIGTKGAGLW